MFSLIVADYFSRQLFQDCICLYCLCTYWMSGDGGCGRHGGGIEHHLDQGVETVLVRDSGAAGPPSQAD